MRDENGCVKHAREHVESFYYVSQMSKCVPLETASDIFCQQKNKKYTYTQLLEPIIIAIQLFIAPTCLAGGLLYIFGIE